MKSLLTVILTILCLAGNAQPKPGTTTADSTPTKTDTTHSAINIEPNTQPDDEFSIFLMLIGFAFVCVAIGAAFAGTIAATLFLIVVFALISAGIISAGILVGLYRRSLTAGFRTMLILICSGITTIGGAIALLLINRIFHLYLTSTSSLLIGAFSGLLGGILLGFILSGIIKLFLDYCRKKLSF